MFLTNTQYNTIMRQYQEQQLKNQHILQQRIQQAYEQCPDLKKIEDSIASVSIRKARLLLDGNDDALTSLKEELQQLILRKEQLLKELGYMENYFEPPYRCKDCKDTGYIGNKKCHCFRQASLDLIYHQSNMYAILQKENFDTFSYDYFSKTEIDSATGLSSYQNAQNAFSICQNFIKNFDTSFENLLIYGNTGVGKTFLSNCIAKELIDTEHSVIYFTTFELFQLFQQAAFHGNNSAGNEYYQDLFDCDLLIIDDLGTELINSFTTSQLFICLNERILRRKSTIISTNLSLIKLTDLYSERVFSRITSYYTILKMFGSDIRVQKKIHRQ